MAYSDKVISLEEIVVRLIDQAELSLQKGYSDKGLRLLRQADRLYATLGYRFQVECRMNDVFLQYAGANYSAHL